VTGLRIIINPKIIDRINNIIPLISFSSQEGIKAKEVNNIPTPGLKILYKTILYANNLFFQESTFKKLTIVVKIEFA